MIGLVIRRGSSQVFVGRRRELDRLGYALDRAAAGEPSLVLVAGEAGIGKSRLVAEFTARARDAGAWDATGACLDLGEGGRPYAPVVQAIRVLARRFDPDARAEAFGPSSRLLAAYAPELGRAGARAERRDEADPDGRLGRLFDAIIDVLGRLSLERPLAIVLEDIHWADGSTRDLVRFLVRNLSTERVLLVTTYRSDDLHRRHPLMPTLAELERAERVERLDLARFDRDEVMELLSGMIGHDPPPATVEALLQRSDGIPFYVEELVADDSAGAGSLPSTLRDILELRLAGLSPAALELVRTASAIGVGFDDDRLTAVCALDEAAMLESLREAIEARILVASDDVDGRGYAFRHALLREAAYDDLLPAERSRLHTRLADHLERRLTAEAATDPATASDLAFHAYHAHDLPRALAGATRALHALIDAVAYREAYNHAEQALELWPHVPDAADITGLRHSDLVALAAAVAGHAGELRRAVALHRRAVDEMGREGDPERLASELAELYLAAWEDWDPGVAQAAASRASELLPGLGPTKIRARLLVVVAFEDWIQGRILPSLGLLEEAVAQARATGDHRARVFAASLLAHTLADLGRCGAAEQLADEVLRDGIVFEGSAWAFYAAGDLGFTFELIGRFEDAVRVSTEAAEAATRYGVFEHLLPWFLPIDAMFELGRLDEALAIGERMRASSAGSHPLLNDWLVRSKVHTIRGELDDARTAIPPAHWALAEATRAWRSEPLLMLARAHRDFDQVRIETEELLRILANGEAISATWMGLAPAIGAAADAAVRARRRRRTADVDEATRLATAWTDVLRSLSQDAEAHGGAGALCAAILATTEAEVNRAASAPQPDPWLVALDRWLAIGQRYQAAYTRLRLAEAVLESHGDRVLATDALRDAYDVSVDLRAAPLRAEIEALATRSQINLGIGAEGTVTLKPSVLLTRRERAVLRLVAEGHTNREIGGQLFISEKTVSVHVSNAMAKLGALSRYEAAASAEREGLL